MYQASSQITIFIIIISDHLIMTSTQFLVLVVIMSLTSLHPARSTNPVGEKASRKRNVEHFRLRAYGNSCKDAGSPCACIEVKKNVTKSTLDGGDIKLEYLEFSCDVELNEKRMKEGRIPALYSCINIMGHRTIFRYRFIAREL